MGDFFKTAVIGAAITAVGVATGGAGFAIFSAAVSGAIVSAGVGIIATGLLGELTKQEPPDFGNARQREDNVLSGAMPNRFVFGTIRMGGNLQYHQAHGANDQVSTFTLVVCPHVVSGYGDLYLSNELVELEDDGSGRLQATADSPFFSGRPRVRAEFFDGTQSTPNGYIQSLEDSTWQNTSIGHEQSYLTLSYDYVPSVFRSGRPTAAIIVDGIACHDPRTGQTAFTKNPALIAAAFIQAPIGYSSDYAQIDEASLIAAANVCDEDVLRPAPDNTGEMITEKRYEACGYIEERTSPARAIEQLALAMAGQIFYEQGKWRFLAGGARLPVDTVTGKDILLSGGAELVAEQSLDGLYNAIGGLYSSAETAWTDSDYPHFDHPEAITKDGERLYKDLDLKFTPTGTMCQSIARIWLATNRLQKRLKITLRGRALFYELGDVLNLHVPELGLDNAHFEIESYTHNLQDMTISVQLREYDATIFDPEPTSLVSIVTQIGQSVVDIFSIGNTLESTRGFFDRHDLGLDMQGDDEADQFNKEITNISESGGGQIVLSTPKDGALTFLSRVTVPGNIDLTVSGHPVRLGRYATFRLGGELAFREDVPALRIAQTVPAGSSVMPLAAGDVAGSQVVAGTRIRWRGAGGVDLPTEPRFDSLVQSANAITDEITLARPTEATLEPIWSGPLADAYFAKYGRPDETLGAIYIASAMVGPTTIDNATILAGRDWVAIEPTGVTLYAPGDVVLLMDDMLAADIAGLSNNRIHVEMAKVRAVDVVNAVLYFTEALSKQFRTDFNAAVFLVRAGQGSRLHNTQFQIIEQADPASRRVPVIEMGYADHCVVENCRVLLKPDGFMHRGDGLRTYRSIDCRRNGNLIEASPWSDSAESYGITDNQAKGSRGQNNLVIARRHGALAQTATDCSEVGFTNHGTLGAAVDCHGLNSHRVHYQGRVTAGTELAVGFSRHTAVAIGNTFHRAGDHHCSFDIVAEGFIHDSDILVRVEAPSSYWNGVIRSTRCYTAFYHQPSDEDPTQVAIGGFVTFDVGEAVNGIDVDGDKQGETHDDGTGNLVPLYPLRLASFNGEIRIASKPVKMQNTLAVKIGCFLRLDGSGQTSSVIDVKRCPKLEVIGADVGGGSAGVRLEDSPGAILVRSVYRDISGGNKDAGGNAGFVYRDNTFIGGSSSGELVSVASGPTSERDVVATGGGSLAAPAIIVGYDDA